MVAEIGMSYLHVKKTQGLLRPPAASEEGYRRVPLSRCPEGHLDLRLLVS